VEEASEREGWEIDEGNGTACQGEGGEEERSNEPTMHLMIEAPLACQPGIAVPKLRPILLSTHSKPLRSPVVASLLSARSS